MHSNLSTLNIDNCDYNLPKFSHLCKVNNNFRLLYLVHVFSCDLLKNSHLCKVNNNLNLCGGEANGL